MDTSQLSLPAAAPGYDGHGIAQNPLFGGSAFNASGTNMDIDTNQLAPLQQDEQAGGPVNAQGFVATNSPEIHVLADGSVVFAPSAAPQVMLKQECQLKEFCLLSEQKGPKAYVPNEVAILEMERIAEAAHMKENFRILQPTFFSSEDHNVPLQENIFCSPKVLPPNLCTPNVLAPNISTPNVLAPNLGNANILTPIFPIQYSFPSSGSINTSLSSSEISSAIGSHTSFDSNISQASLPVMSMSRVPSVPLRMGRMDMSSARELANLEAQRRMLDLRIKKLKKGCWHQDVCKVTELWRSVGTKTFLIVTRNCTNRNDAVKW